VSIRLPYPYLPGADVPDSLAEALQRNLEVLALAVAGTSGYEFSGTGSPETVVTAPVGARFRRLDGGAGTSLYVKESGTGNVGWIGK
jgi:hypothetical protein